MRVVIPAAGLGSRFLPLSRTVPKELLLLGDRPLIHHALDEAARAGFETAVLVVSPAKPLIRAYLDGLDEVPLPVAYVEQRQAAGLGDAVLLAAGTAGVPFAVLLPDDVLEGSEHWEQVRELHRRTGAAVICVRRVPWAKTPRFGVAVCVARDGRLQVMRLVEKPPPGTAPSNDAVLGRYLVTEEVLQGLRGRRAQAGGELQLTAGFAAAAGRPPGVLAVTYHGEVHDSGTPSEYVRSMARLWSRGAEGRNAAMVRTLRDRAVITSPAVEDAFSSVLRHHFLPDLSLGEVYQDQAIPIKREHGVPVSSSSQPAIMAIMLQQLQVEAGHNVLEIGAGTGYNAGLLKYLAGPRGRVTTVDIDGDLAEAARRHLEAAGITGVTVVEADGGLGHPPAAPYARIILTVGAWDIAPAWAVQLEVGGRLVLPLTIRGGIQASIAFSREQDHLQSVDIQPCGFMPLRGEFAGPGAGVQIGADATLGLGIDDPTLVDAEAIDLWLAEGGVDRPLGMVPDAESSLYGAQLALALASPAFCTLRALGSSAERRDLPDMQTFGGGDGSKHSYGFASRRGLALLHRRHREVWIRAFGDDPLLVDQLGEALRRWSDQGRPDFRGLRVRAQPLGTPHSPRPEEAVIEKRWHRLIFDRP